MGRHTIFLNSHRLVYCAVCSLFSEFSQSSLLCNGYHASLFYNSCLLAYYVISRQTIPFSRFTSSSLLPTVPLMNPSLEIDG